MADIVMCNTKIGPYHAARIRALSELVDDVLAVEVAGAEALYPWWRGIDGIEVRKTTLFPGRSFETVPVGEQVAAMTTLLQREQPRAVIVDGYSEPVMRAAAGWARRSGRRSILLMISWVGDRRRLFLREWQKRFLLRGLFTGVCVGGERQYAYARLLGVEDRRLWRLYNVVDNAHFIEGALAARAQAAALRARLGLPERYFLYVGQIAPWKNLRTLMQAYRQYRARGGDWELVVVGCGPDQAALQETARAQGIPGVHWPGPQPYEALPAYYALGSCFVLPSLREPWGLVVNEAEACGLPVLASTQCGCLPELVHRGVNGYAFAPRDIDGLAGLMTKMSTGVDLAALSAASREIVGQFTPRRWARALADCLRDEGGLS